MLVRHEPRDFEAIAGHARQPARPAQQRHPMHAAVAQDLRADTVAAQVHAAAHRRMRGACGAFELREQLRPLEITNTRTILLALANELDKGLTLL